MCSLTVHQKGAGNGKTYGIWKSIAENKNKNIFIILTKQHSAKHVIFNEFNEQAQRNEYHMDNLEEVQINVRSKHYVIKYSNKKSKRSCTVIIGTIDSYMFNMSVFTSTTSDFFCQMIDTISQSGCTKIDKTGCIQYAGESVCLDINTELWIDEAQDLPVNYLYAILKIISQTMICVHVVGDILQSLCTEKNLFTVLCENEKFYENINIIRSESINSNRRIKVNNLHTELNMLIQFEKYNLPEIELSMQCDSNTPNPFEILDQPIIYKQSNEVSKLSAFIDLILIKMDYEIYTHHYVPEDFMFIFPIMKSNDLANELEMRLDEFWTKSFQNEEYLSQLSDPYWKNYDHEEYTQYAYLHKHEAGSVINLAASERATRLVTIKTSKGDGRNVVFVLNVTENTLKVMTDQQINLLYESYLHVALTRAKRKVYFGLQQNGDDICDRMFKIAPENAIRLCPTISKCVRLSDVIKTMDKEKFIDSIKAFDIENDVKHFCDNLEDSKSNSSNIDWKYFCIRKSVAYNYILFQIVKYILNNHKKHNKKDCQIIVVLNKISKLEIIKHTPKDFYNILRECTRKKIDLPYLPLCNRDGLDVYKRYSSIIAENIEELKEQCERKCVDSLNELDVYKMFLLEYCISIYKHKNLTDIQPCNVYDITHFVESANTSIELATLEESDIRKQTCDCINFIKLQSKSYIKWNIEKYITYNGKNDNFTIYKPDYNFIGFDDECVYHIVFQTSLNGLNLWESILSVIMERFLIYNSKSEKDKLKYENKTIKTFFIVLNQSSFKKVEWKWDKQMTEKIMESIKHTLITKYTPYHEKLYYYCLHLKVKNEEKNPYEHIAKELNSNTPEYLIRFFSNLPNDDPLMNKKSEFCQALDILLKEECNLYT